VYFLMPPIQLLVGAVTYEPESGRVLIDSTDARDWPLAELRAALGYVEQDAPVLSGTLLENLLFGAPDATEADLRDVLATARIDRMVAADAAQQPGDTEFRISHS
jgi:ABC-type multidrug transport system fused ATPase/permease subunit